MSFTELEELVNDRVSSIDFTSFPSPRLGGSSRVSGWIICASTPSTHLLQARGSRLFRFRPVVSEEDRSGEILWLATVFRPLSILERLVKGVVIDAGVASILRRTPSIPLLHLRFGWGGEAHGFLSPPLSLASSAPHLHEVDEAIGDASPRSRDSDYILLP